VKQVPDTWGERKLDLTTGILDRGASDPVIDEIDERALEVALSYQDAHGAEVVALSVGPASVVDSLRKALAMGADSAVHVLDDSLAGADAWVTAAVIAAAVSRTGFDVVIAGNESTDGRGGVVPAMVAEHLGVPHATFLDSVSLTESAVSGERSTEGGTLAVSADLPAVISVTERTPEARFPNFRGIMKAKKKPLEQLSLADLDVDTSSGRSVVVSVAERPERTAGTKIVDSGDAGILLAEFLRSNRLI
jgi:electron transfer flavoprotein beta subunit